MNSLLTHLVTISAFILLGLFVWLNLVLNFWPLIVLAIALAAAFFYSMAYTIVDDLGTIRRWQREWKEEHGESEDLADRLGDVIFEDPDKHH